MTEPRKWVPPMWQIDLLMGEAEPELRALRVAVESSKPILTLLCDTRHVLGRMFNVNQIGPVLFFKTSTTFAVANRDPILQDPYPSGLRQHRWHHQAAPLDPACDKRIGHTRDSIELAAAEQEWVDLQCRCCHGCLTRADLRLLLTAGPQRTVPHLR